jgi:hypothetical protein
MRARAWTLAAIGVAAAFVMTGGPYACRTISSPGECIPQQSYDPLGSCYETCEQRRLATPLDDSGTCPSTYTFDESGCCRPCFCVLGSDALPDDTGFHMVSDALSDGSVDATLADGLADARGGDATANAGGQ